MSDGYPANREADVVLHDGSTVHLRPVRGADEAALREFFAGLSFQSRAFRFFSGAVDLERAAAALADVDYAERYGLVAVRGGERVVGHGSTSATRTAVPRSPKSTTTRPSSPRCCRRTTGWSRCSARAGCRP